MHDQQRELQNSILDGFSIGSGQIVLDVTSSNPLFSEN